MKLTEILVPYSYTVECIECHAKGTAMWPPGSFLGQIVWEDKCQG